MWIRSANLFVCNIIHIRMKLANNAHNFVNSEYNPISQMSIIVINNFGSVVIVVDFIMLTTPKVLSFSFDPFRRLNCTPLTIINCF